MLVTRPGWRDFERVVALALGGQAQESKAIFDVLLSAGKGRGVWYGLSCKMRSELNRIDRDGRVTIEVSNSAGQFWDHLATRGIHQGNYRTQPEQTGSMLLDVVRGWHGAVGLGQGGSIDLAGSSYLVLSWNKNGWYQLHQFSLELPDAQALAWRFPKAKRGKVEREGRRLVGSDQAGTLFEWYGESGGQLKYYPLASAALWHSQRFQLEPLPDVEHGLRAKASTYFPELWARANQAK